MNVRMGGMSERTVVEVPIRWSDMDAYGHVNNVQYLRYLEEARVQVFRDWFGQRRDLLDEGVLVARAEIDYLLPLVFGHLPAEITMWCSRISGASYELAYEVRVQGGEEVYARAETTMVSFDLAQNRPRRLSSTEREVLQARFHAPVPLRRRSDR